MGADDARFGLDDQVADRFAARAHGALDERTRRAGGCGGDDDGCHRHAFS
jgi:hypothetical protein